MQELKLVYRDPGELNPYTNNPRVNEPALPKLKEDIQEFGFVSPVLVAGEEIVDGHARHKVALEMELEKIPTVDVSHLTPDQIRALRLVMNKSAEWAQWDEERLLEELQALQDIDIDMGAFGFDLSAFEPEAEIQDDDFDCTPPTEPKAERGALYRLGRHFLMCGDSTEPGDVSRLMAGELADLLLTDPPYNVDYEGGTAEHLKIDNDHMSEEDYRVFLCAAFGAADAVMRPGAAFYLWHADSNRQIVQGACGDTGWRVRQNLIWRKNHFAMGRQDYHWQHEPCLYGWKGGAAHYFIDDRTQTTVYETLPDIGKMSKADLKDLVKRLLEKQPQTTVLLEDKPLASLLHPTMKPVPLMGRLIQNSSRKEERVLDLFGGAGATLIAAEQLGRICYMMEYDPRYVDVIIDRWEAFTNEKAERIK